MYYLMAQRSSQEILLFLCFLGDITSSLKELNRVGSIADTLKVSIPCIELLKNVRSKQLKEKKLS